ncbi:MAG: F0F1 ATP synthase subunit B, partial [Planctomycetota bacterium]
PGGILPSRLHPAPTQPHLMKRLLPFVAVTTLALPAMALAAEAGEDPSKMITDVPSKIIPAVFTLIVFTVVVAILGKFAFGPIAKGLQEREDRIRDDIAAAEQTRIEAEKKQAEYAEQLATAEAKVRELMAEAQKNAENVVAKAKTDAQTEADAIKDRTNRELEDSRVAAVSSVRAEAATLATMVAEKILRREINAEDQQRLVQESLEALDQLETA